MRKLILPLFIFIISCVQGTVDEQINITTPINISVPVSAPISGVVIPPTTLTQTRSIDISDAINQVEKVGTPSIAITQNHLHSNMGDFSFFDAVDVSISSNTTGQTEQLISVILTPDQKSSTDLDIPVEIDNTMLFQILNSGSSTLTFNFTVEGAVPSNLTLDLVSTIDMDVSLSVNKSISDIGQQN